MVMTAPVRSVENLRARVLSGTVLAVAGMAAAWTGGLVWWLICTLCGVILLLEWKDVTRAGARPGVFLAQLTVFGLMMVLLGAGLDAFALALGALTLGAVAALGLLRSRGTHVLAWAGAGCVAILALMLAAILLRRGEWGFAALLLVFCVIWACDTAAYFAGRRWREPRLWPSLSPNKTWAGVGAGLTAGVAAGLVISPALGVPAATAALLAFVLALAGLGGDLAESWVKRRFGRKDAGRLIPGHGGLLDRLDGFSVAMMVALGIGLARGGLERTAEGLLVW